MTRYWDILGQVFTTPDPIDLEDLAWRHRAVCDDVADSRSRLEAIGARLNSAVWAGPAASAFAQTYGALPGQLDRAWKSYYTVANVLFRYAGEVSDIGRRLSAINAAAQEAQATVVMLSGHGGNPGRLSEAQAEVATLTRSLGLVREDLNACAATCVAAIQLASSEGMQNRPDARLLGQGHRQGAGRLTKEREQRLVVATRNGRAGTAADVAATIEFLASAGAGHITGQVIHVNGGTYLGR
jgi:NAD(P)-dependent dehydrogenase (short-subunit alcohol dehydrogenase family)